MRHYQTLYHSFFLSTIYIYYLLYSLFSIYILYYIFSIYILYSLYSLFFSIFSCTCVLGLSLGLQPSTRARSFPQLYPNVLHIVRDSLPQAPLRWVVASRANYRRSRKSGKKKFCLVCYLPVNSQSLVQHVDSKGRQKEDPPIPLPRYVHLN